MINEAKKYFDENGYVVIQNFIKPEMFCLLYEYMKMKARRELLNEAYYPESYISHINGKFDDTQAIGAYSLYGDPLMDSLLQNSTNFISNTIEVDLIPTYSYWRLYITDNDLKNHKDRPSCEYSTTLCIGYDASNVKEKDYNWPIYIRSFKGEVKSVMLYASIDSSSFKYPPIVTCSFKSNLFINLIKLLFSLVTLYPANNKCALLHS